MTSASMLPSMVRGALPADICALVAGGGLTLRRQGQFTKGSYGAYSDLWNLAALETALGRPAIEGVDYATDIRLRQSSFPNGVKLSGFVPPNGQGLGGGTIYGSPHIWYGDYHGGLVPVPVLPVQVRDLVTFDIDMSFVSNVNLAGRQVLDEWYLTRHPGYTSDAEMIYEIGLFPDCPPATASYIDAAAQIGTYTDENGIRWKCAKAAAVASGGFVMLRPLDASLVKTPVNRKRLLVWLLSQGVITGNEWVNGAAAMVEPRYGAWDIDYSYSASLVGGVPSSVAVPALSDSSWTEDASAKSGGNGFLELATTAAHGVYSNNIARGAGIKLWSITAEVEAINGRTFGSLRVWPQYFGGAGFAQVWFNLATGLVTFSTATGAWTVSNAFVSKIPGSATRYRVGFDFVTDAASVNLTASVSTMLDASTQSFLGDVTKGMRLHSIKLYDSTFVVKAPAAPVLTPGNGQLSVALPGTLPAGAITGWDVKYKTAAGSVWTTVTPSSFPLVITALTNGIPYDVRLVAKNTAGNSDESPTATATPSVVFYQDDFSATSGSLEAQVTISGGRLNFTATGAGFRTWNRALAGFIAGKSYRFTVDISRSAGNYRIGLIGSGAPVTGYQSASGTGLQFTLVAAASCTGFFIQAPDAGTTVWFDNLSIEELP